MSEFPIYHHICQLLHTQRISDFHLQSGKALTARIEGNITSIPNCLITHDELDKIFKSVLSDVEYQKFYQNNDIDFTLTIKTHRFRANGYRVLEGWALVLRVIVDEIPDIEQLGLPEAVNQSLLKESGLILITGSTGSGKSTSLAAIINKINKEHRKHIITIEDPVEFIHHPIKSIISQREVGRNTNSFSSALRGALRQDPDIILLGELRDYETISMALTAAETGHLVFGTLHTSGAIATINRILDTFPSGEQSQARNQLSQSLQLILAQTLLERKNKDGRIAAFELMVCIPAIRNLIRENKIEQINTTIQTNAKHGMITMEKYIEELEQHGLI